MLILGFPVEPARFGIFSIFKLFSIFTHNRTGLKADFSVEPIKPVSPIWFLKPCLIAPLGIIKYYFKPNVWCFYANESSLKGVYLKGIKRNSYLFQFQLSLQTIKTKFPKILFFWSYHGQDRWNSLSKSFG